MTAIFNRYAAIVSAVMMSAGLTTTVQASGYSGPYIGVAAFYSSATTDASVLRVSTGATTKASGDAEGMSVAGAAGYDWKVGSAGVVGVVGDLGLAKPGDSMSYVMTLRARAGVLVSPDTLIYATGGVATLKNDLSGRLGGFEYQLKGWVPGWAVGAGIERRFQMGDRGMRLGAEVGYLDFNTRKFEVVDRQAKLDITAWSIGARVSFELGR